MIDSTSANAVLNLRSKWPDIADDLCLLTFKGMPQEDRMVSLQALCAQYDITTSVVSALLENKEFINIFKEYKARYEAQGTTSSLPLRAYMMTTKLLENLFSEAINPNTSMSTAERIRLLENCMVMSGADPRVTGAGKSGNKDKNVGAIATTVKIYVPAGIPGVSHAGDVIEVSPTVVGEIDG